MWKKDIAVHADIMENYWAVDPECQALYFGESSNFHRAKNDTTKYRISHMIDSELDQIKIGTVDNAGIHAGTYRAVLQNIEESSKVKILIVTMNLRSFSAGWRYALGENYLSKTETMLSTPFPLLNRFLVSLKYYDHQSDSERLAQCQNAWKTEKFKIPNFQYENVHNWDSAMAWQEWMNRNPHLNEENIPLACHYIKNFAFEINPTTNERIADFDEFMKISVSKNFTVIFNILAENMEQVNKLVGQELIYLMEKNRDFLIDRYERQGAIVVDNLYAIPYSMFVDRDWPTEHYTREGKAIIAKNIAQYLKQIIKQKH